MPDSDKQSKPEYRDEQLPANEEKLEPTKDESEELENLDLEQVSGGGQRLIYNSSFSPR